jgi:hypothetical protein
MGRLIVDRPLRDAISKAVIVDCDGLFLKNENRARPHVRYVSRIRIADYGAEILPTICVESRSLAN